MDSYSLTSRSSAVTGHLKADGYSLLPYQLPELPRTSQVRNSNYIGTDILKKQKSL